jgi:hypothetical protein
MEAAGADNQNQGALQDYHKTYMPWKASFWKIGDEKWPAVWPI